MRTVLRTIAFVGTFLSFGVVTAMVTQNLLIAFIAGVLAAVLTADWRE